MLKRGLIVSCQATEDEPLHGSLFMAKMAKAAEIGGAVGVRINTVSDIEAVKKEVNIPVIGIIKKEYVDYFPYITPTLEEVEKVYNAGAEIVAVDATKYNKPKGETTIEFIKKIKNNYNMKVMADVSTVEEGIIAEEAGADYVATTLSGYTPYTKSEKDIKPEFQSPDFEIVRNLVERVDIPVIAEGKFWDYRYAIEALKLGAHSVVIGAGITRPQIITEKNVYYINSFLNNN